jgi:hypothetical protein
MDIFNLRIIIYNLKFQVRQCIKLMFKVISSNFIFLSTVEINLVKQVIESCLWNLSYVHGRSSLFPEFHYLYNELL